MKKEELGPDRYHLPMRVYEARDGSHYEETREHRPLEDMSRGDIVWFIIGHIVLLPLALLVLLVTALCLPLYIIWSKVRKPVILESDIHGETWRLLYEREVQEQFIRGSRDDAQPKISVIMPFYNREDWVDWCVGSVLSQKLPDDWDVELIVVDNGSTDNTVERLKAFPVRLIHCAERGPGAARNAGIAAARAPILAFTDSDCIVDSHWLKHLTEPLMQDPEMILTGGDILARQVDRYVASFANQTAILSNYRFFSPGPYFARFFATANMACRREHAQAIGGFDKSLWVGEDADFCWRLLELGGRMGFCFNAVIYHQHRTGMAGMFRQAVDYGAGSVATFAKHRDNYGVRWAVSWKNIRDIAWSPFNIIVDQFTAEKPYDRIHEILYCLWRLGFTIGSLRECWRKKVLFV